MGDDVWRRQRAHLGGRDTTTARGERAQDAPPCADAPPPLEGQALFASRTGAVVDLDCLLEAAGSLVGVPVHFTWELPHDAGVAAWQLSLVEGWLSEGKQVRVTFQSRPAGARARFLCGETTLLVDTPVLTDSR